MAAKRKARKKGLKSGTAKAPWNRQREVIEAAASKAGLTVRVMNSGNHWQFVGGAFLVNWYPTTGTIYVDGTKHAMRGTWNTAIQAAASLPKDVQIPVKRPGRKERRARADLKHEMLKAYPHCHWCGARLRYLTASFEHIIPLSRGGLDGGSNVVLACYPCNRKHANNISSNRTDPAEPTDEWATVTQRNGHLPPPVKQQRQELPEAMFERLCALTYRVDRRRVG